MTFGSVCSGIEAATVAWHPLGWQAAFYAEIDAFPSAVLAHHYPAVPNWGDLTRFHAWPDATLDLLVGGTPCQSFSVAGLRAGLADPRGNLALTFLAVVDRYRPRWVVWENVPGVLSSGDGRDFGAFLGGLSELGYGWAYRVLDAQYFGLAQRRRRVFVVASARGWQRAAAVLFERESLSGHPAPRREAGQDAPAGTLRSTDGGLDCDHAAASHLVAHALRTDGFDASEDGTGRGTPLVPMAFQPGNLRRGAGADPSVDVFPTLKADHGRGLSDQFPHVAHAFDARQSDVIQYGDQVGPLDTYGNTIGVLAFAQNQIGEVRAGDIANTLNTNSNASGRNTAMTMQGMAVRRLTPRECERLQGFPDDYTLIPYRGKPAADGPRYKALGNSMAVPVMRWIGERIAAVDAIARNSEAVA